MPSGWPVSEPMVVGKGDDFTPEEPYPFQAHIGFRHVEWERDRAVFELDLAPCHMNRYGIPHGGLYGVLIDTAMGFAGCYTGDPDDPIMAMTLSLTTNFLSQPTGDRLIVEGRRTGGGRRTFFAEAEIRDENATVVARGSGVFRYRQSPAASGACV